MLLFEIGAAAALTASLPYWLPRTILRLRMAIFERINGPDGIAVPGRLVGTDNFRAVYAHPAANGRSRGAALSDLFWYWLSPGAELHQEHLEPGPRYEAAALATRRFLAVPKIQAEALASRCAGIALRGVSSERPTLVRLRDLMMPIWAAFYYELVFGEPCPAQARDLIVANSRDVVTALKCCGLRHMDRRHRLTAFLVARIRQGGLVQALPELGSPEQQALYLQGVFFNTAIVQMSEAMTHLLMAVAQHRDVQQRLGEPKQERNQERYLDWVIAETLRHYPLFGIAHRITTDEIVVDAATTIPRGSVLCFSHLDYQRSGFADPDHFEPKRWEHIQARDATYIPFGVTANRPCPAQAISLVTMRAVARAVLDRYACHSSAAHTRSIPNRGPCLLVPRGSQPSTLSHTLPLAFMALRDRWEDVWRSIVQLVLGTAMVLHARHLRLCQRYFEFEATHEPPAAMDAVPPRCPMEKVSS